MDVAETKRADGCDGVKSCHGRSCSKVHRVEYQRRRKVFEVVEPKVGEEEEVWVLWRWWSRERS